MIWLLFGAPGSGKGTQSKLLTQNFGFEHLSTGDVFRKHLKEETELGLKVKSILDKGELVSDEIVIDMVSEEVNPEKTTVLDGFPRTLEQGKALSVLADKTQNPVSGVIFLDVPQTVLVSRLTGRRVCKGCGSVYHVEASPTQTEGVCDKCGGEVIQRKDDSAEVIENRLSVYESQTKPLMDYYNELGLLKKVDGQGSTEEVFERVKDILK